MERFALKSRRNLDFGCISKAKHLHDSPIKSPRSRCPQHVQLHAIIYSSHKQDLKPKPGICCFMTCRWTPVI